MMPELPHRELGQKVADFVRSGKEDHSGLWAECFHADFESVESDGKSWKGVAEVQKKHDEWGATTEMHSCEVAGPYCGPTGFSMQYTFDAESKDSSWPRMKMSEIGVYTVRDGKIVGEEFMAAPMPGM